MLNGLVLFFVIGSNIDHEKYFWETFFHAFPVGLLLLAFIVMLESAVMALCSCCVNGRSTVEGVELEPLADVEAQHDRTSFGYKA